MGYLRMREEGEIFADRDSIISEVAQDLHGISAVICDMVEADSLTDKAALEVVGDQLHAMALALDATTKI